MKQVLSCVQPTGNLHLGRYFGAVQNWVELQSTYKTIFGVVNYHAMTMPYQPRKLAENTWDLIFNLIACGLKKEHIFIQSLIPEHTELGWIMGCFCSYGDLTRMTQFKDKTSQLKTSDKDSFVSSGLFTYPALQAADILIYHADYVPVGRDQDQHLELTRNIANRFNNFVRKEYFTLPEPLYTETPKVMSTADPNRKMSASLGEKHNIDLFADPDKIRKQIRSAVTDTGENTGNEMSVGVANLFQLLKAAGASDQHNALLESYHAGNLKYSELKENVAEALVGLSTPIREKREALLADKKQVKNDIKASSEVIRKRAIETVREVKELVGIQSPKYFFQ